MRLKIPNLDMLLPFGRTQIHKTQLRRALLRFSPSALLERHHTRRSLDLHVTASRLIHYSRTTLRTKSELSCPSLSSRHASKERRPLKPWDNSTEFRIRPPCSGLSVLEQHCSPRLWNPASTNTGTARTAMPSQVSGRRPTRSSLPRRLARLMLWKWPDEGAYIGTEHRVAGETVGFRHYLFPRMTL